MDGYVVSIRSLFGANILRGTFGRLWILFIMERTKLSAIPVRVDPFIKTLICYSYCLLSLRRKSFLGAKKLFRLGQILDQECSALSVHLQGLAH